MSDWKMTIGIECHVQLATKTKLFSPADNDATNREPNSVVHPIDYGLPGMLPLLNKQAITLAVRAAKALKADVAEVSRFDRKHYFYPDLPMGYQITQMYHPTILTGTVNAYLPDGTPFSVGIHHAHIESDAGKQTHHSDHTLVDLNRAGTPLIEIVSEPDMHSAAEARAFATELYRLMTYAGVTHGDLYHGNMRFDVNVSVAKSDSPTLGKRAEVKNLNSFRSVEKAAEFEFKRQVEMLERGEVVVQETRGWDDAKQLTVSQRSKEDAQDYRYMPDADIPPVVLGREEIDAIQRDVGMLPDDYRNAFRDLGVDGSVVNTLLDNRFYAKTVYDSINEAGLEIAKYIAHWFSSSMTALKEGKALPTIGLFDEVVRLSDLITLAEMTRDSKVSSTGAKQIFYEIIKRSHDGVNASPSRIADELDLLQVSDEASVISVVEEVLADKSSEKSILDINNGNEKAIGYLVGQVMKRSAGKANPTMAQKLIRERLK